MIGDPADVLLANAWAFGARDFDASAALSLMRRGAEDPTAACNDIPPDPGWLSTWRVTTAPSTEPRASMAPRRAPWSTPSPMPPSLVSPRPRAMPSSPRSIVRDRCNWREVFDHNAPPEPSPARCSRDVCGISLGARLRASRRRQQQRVIEGSLEQYTFRCRRTCLVSLLRSG